MQRPTQRYIHPCNHQQGRDRRRRNAAPKIKALQAEADRGHGADSGIGGFGFRLGPAQRQREFAGEGATQRRVTFDFPMFELVQQIFDFPIHVFRITVF